MISTVVAAYANKSTRKIGSALSGLIAQEKLLALEEMNSRLKFAVLVTGTLVSLPAVAEARSVRAIYADLNVAETKLDRLEDAQRQLADTKPLDGRRAALARSHSALEARVRRLASEFTSRCEVGRLTASELHLCAMVPPVDVKPSPE